MEELIVTEGMRERYVARRKDDLTKLEIALKERDEKTLASVSHQIKGNAATFSHFDLEKSAKALEDSVKRHDLNAAAEAVSAIRSWLDAQCAKLDSRSLL